MVKPKKKFKKVLKGRILNNTTAIIYFILAIVSIIIGVSNLNYVSEWRNIAHISGTVTEISIFISGMVLSIVGLFVIILIFIDIATSEVYWEESDLS